MGYDMYLVERDASKDEEMSRVEKELDSVRNKMDALDRESEEGKELRNRVMELYEERDKYNVSYFRLNIFGMGQMLRDMEELGMIRYRYAVPDFPRPEDFGLTHEQVEEAYENDEEEEAVLSGPPSPYFRAARAHLAWSPLEGKGLPAHKFGSNDGWIVTPLDIEQALELFEAAPEQTKAAVRERWTFEESEGCIFDDWLDFLRRAKNFGGFRVW